MTCKKMNLEGHACKYEYFGSLENHESDNGFCICEGKKLDGNSSISIVLFGRS